jgi:ribonuclease BN (tRNA processing enzyme)
MPVITFLGVGGAMPVQPADNHTALLVAADGATLLLDCGPTIMRQLEQVGADAGLPTHLYLSHQHGDHILGLPMLLLNRMLFFPDQPLSVLAVPSVLHVAQQLVRLAYPDLLRRIQDAVAFVPLLEAEQGQAWPGVAGLRYRLARAQHSVPTYALRLDWPGGASMVFSADTGPAPALARLAEGVDLLVHDAFYLTASDDDLSSHSAACQVGRLAAQAGVKAVALVHRRHTEQPLAQQYQAEAAKFFGGEILAPAAGDSYRFPKER